MAKFELTDDQRVAVENRGGSLLVSAAAGSGKTKVLVERLFRYIMQEQCAVDDFLIITYTKAAAAELRGKIAAELSKRVAEHPEDGHLRRQLFRVYQADIKTVDAFCAALLRENTYLLPTVEGHSLTPDFRVLDEQEADLVKERVLGRVLEDFYAHMDDKAEQLAETLGAGRDDRALEKLVLELHRKLQSHPYPLQWLEKVRREWETLPEDLGQSPYGQVIMADAAAKADFWAAQLEKTADGITDDAVAAAYADRMTETAAQLRQLAAARGDWAAMAAIRPAFRRMGAVRGENPEKEQIQALLKPCKDALKKLTAPFETPQNELLADMAVMAPAMLALADLTAEFTCRYQAEKVRRNAMDFSDQEHYAIELLLAEGQPTELARQVAGRYREIMVDEYQDTNDVQNCIFSAISQQEQNLFTVGDVKQSIYRFRLADPTIFLRKYNAYAPAAQAEDGQPRKVLLLQNFRSRASVLDACNAIFRSIMSAEMGEMDYGPEERLNFGATYYPPHEDTAAEFHLIDVSDTEEEHFDRTAVEARFVADRIRRMLDEGYCVNGGDGLRRCTPEDFVILMRSPRSRLKAFTAALAARGIPCAADESSDFFSSVEIAVVWSLLQIIDNPRQDVPLISVLRSPLFGFTPDRLAAIRALRREGDYYDALLLDESEDTQAFLQTLSQLRSAARDEPVDELLWHIYNTCHCVAVFGAMPGGQARKDNLVALYTYARQLAGAGKKSVFDFVAHLRTLLENGDAPDLSTRQSAGGVQIMSIHKSKGLEFPIVFLCDLSKRFDPRDVQEPVLVHPVLGLGTECVDRERRIRYDTVSKTAVALRLQRESKSEEMRILYVAMTRAQEKMIAVDCMRKARKRVADLAGVAGVPTPPESVAAGRCLGDWVLLPLLCTAPGAKLCQWAEVTPPELTAENGGWQVYLWENPTSAAQAAGEDGVLADLPQETDFDPTPLEWSYDHPCATVTPGKVTATQLKGRAIDEEIAEGAPTRRRAVLFEKPKFLREVTGLTAAEKGTAVHAVMQYIDFRTPPTASAVAGEVEELAQRRLLTAQQAAAVDCAMVARFLSSPLAERIRQAKQVWREYRFTLLTDAALYDPAAAGEELMLQGVVDCAFETAEGGLVVVDFKTDRITAEQQAQRAKSYRPQLEAYALALGQVLEKEVTEKVLYFFHTNSAVKL